MYRTTSFITFLSFTAVNFLQNDPKEREKGNTLRKLLRQGCNLKVTTYETDMHTK